MTDFDATKYIPEKERAEIPAADFAGPGRSFPCNTQAHVYAAAHLYGRAADPEKVRANIIRIARRKGFALPDGWAKDSDDKDGGKSVDTLRGIDVPDQLIAFGSP